MSSELEPFLAPTAFVDSEHPSIRACAERLGLATLTAPARAKRIFDFVRDEIAYEFMAKFRREEYVASRVLADGKGFCVQKAVLFAALARASGLPAGIVLCDMRDHTLSERIRRAIGTDVMHHHGLSAVHVDGRWLTVDASLTPAVLERKGVTPVAFDGRSDALLAPTTRAGGKHVDYIVIHGRYADLPFDQMVAAFADGYRNADLSVLVAMGLKTT